MKRNQKGFTLVEALVAVIILLLVGGIGYFALARQDKANEPAKTNQSTTNQSSPNNSKKYLNIPEFGVRLTLTEEIKDAYYSVRNEGENKYIHLSTHYFDKLKGFESCRSSIGNSEPGLASLRRAKVGDDHFGTPWTQAEFEAFPNSKIGGTYYWITGAQATCWDNTAIPDSDPRAEKAQAIRKAFVDQSAAIEKL